MKPRRVPKPQVRRGADGQWYIHTAASALTLDEAAELGRRLQLISSRTKTAYRTEGASS